MHRLSLFYRKLSLEACSNYCVILLRLLHGKVQSNLAIDIN